MRLAFALTLTLALGCERNPPAATHNGYVAAAIRLTDIYASSRVSKWMFHAHAAGADCDVLIIETPMILGDSIVDAIHYGAGDYGVIEGGVYRFSRDRAFRGTAYKDRSGRYWTFGHLTPAEAAALDRCR